MRVQIVEVPVYVTIDDAIEIAKKLITFKGGDITRDALASTLGHKNTGSGTFIRKMSDLRKYGLIEGRGEAYRATDLANRIAFASSEPEKNQAILEMINNIEVIRKLAEVLPHDPSVSDSEIRSKLVNITKRRPDELEPLMATISKLYKDALPYIDMSSLQRVQTENASVRPQQFQQNKPQQSIVEGSITFIADKINLSLPENVTNLELIKLAIENRIKELKQNEGKKGKEEQKQ